MTFHRRSAEEIQSHLPHVTYLQDKSVTIKGLVIYGSPWTFRRNSPATAFTKPDGTLGSKYWSLIPDNVDILVTHNPPLHILDDNGNLGCAELRQHIFSRIRFDFQLSVDK
jgi:Icc-related predicted phosphoesterase